uniref:AAA family ATPase n=1 Tax=Ferrimicrobium sp. TaxID=2926050 RepID=UPI0026161936
MRLKYLEVNNVLSYGIGEHIDFDQRLTVLVGPNGGGKSNVLRILMLVRDVIRREASPSGTPESQSLSTRIEAICPPHLGMASLSEIRLGVTLTTDDFPAQQSWDSYLIYLFLRGIQASGHAELPRSNEFRAGERSDSGALDEMYSALKEGVLVLRHSRTLDARWKLAYEFEHDGKTFWWAVSDLSSRRYGGHLFIAGSTSSEVPEEYKDRIDVAPGEDHFENVGYGSMFPSGERPIDLRIKSQLASFDSGTIWDELRRADLVGGFVRGASFIWGFERVLAKVLADRIVSDLDDVELGSPITTTMDILAQPSAPAPNIGSPSIPRYLSSLFRWSVGDHAARQRYSEACKIFSDLRGDGSHPELKVSANRNAHVNDVDYVVNDLTPENGHPLKEHHVVQDYAVTIEPMIRRADGTELPLSAIGSGGVELLRLATLLVEDPTSVVLLDEPAAHLHPRAQERLLQFLRKGTAQCIVVSHSPGLLPTWKKGMGATIRISLDENGCSRRRVVSEKTLMEDEKGKADELQRLVLAQPEVKAIPFADWVILVSGQTELIVYPVWFAAVTEDKEFSGDPHFVNFQGDNQFARYLRVVNAFGVRWAAVVDGKSFTPVTPTNSDPNGTANRRRVPMIAKQILEVVGEGTEAQLLLNAIRIIEVPVDDAPAEWFKRWRCELERCGVFTLANCWHNRKKSDGKCEQCGESVKRKTDQCEAVAMHDDVAHIESFEDAVRAYTDLSMGAGEHKSQEAFQLLEDCREPPAEFREMLEKISRFGSVSGHPKLHAGGQRIARWRTSKLHGI